MPSLLGASNSGPESASRGTPPGQIILEWCAVPSEFVSRIPVTRGKETPFTAPTAELPAKILIPHRNNDVPLMKNSSVEMEPEPAGSGSNTMTLAMISVLAGMVLGQRFKVLILVPAIVVALLVSVGFGITRGGTVWSISLMAAATAASVQIGYLVGIGIRHFLLVARASKSSAASLTGSAPASSRYNFLVTPPGERSGPQHWGAGEPVPSRPWAAR
jgi:hypothetical protein